MSTVIGYWRIGGISVRRVSGRMPHPTCVSRSFEENPWERVRESAPGCGPDFTSRTPSGWPGLGASGRLDESASAAGGRPPTSPAGVIRPCHPKPSRPGTTADTGPGCPPRLLDARPGQTHPIRRGAPLCHLVRRPTRPGNELTLRVPDVRAPRRARSGVTRGVGRQLGETVRRAAGWPAEARSMPRWSRRSPGAGPGRRLACRV